MRHFVMCLEIIIRLVITILMLWTTDITCDMLDIDMASKFVIIKKVFLAKVAIWMQKDNISKLVNISSFHVFIQLIKSV